jgi:hypothetical protein
MSAKRSSMDPTSSIARAMRLMAFSSARIATKTQSKDDTGFKKTISSISRGLYGKSILSGAIGDLKKLTSQINDILGPECARCGHVLFWHSKGIDVTADKVVHAHCKYSKEEDTKKCKCKEFTNSNLVYFKKKYGKR